VQIPLANHQVRLLGLIAPAASMAGSPWSPDEMIFVFGRLDGAANERESNQAAVTERTFGLFSMPESAVKEFSDQIESGLSGAALRMLLANTALDLRCEGVCGRRISDDTPAAVECCREAPVPYGRKKLGDGGRAPIDSLGYIDLGSSFRAKDSDKSPELAFAMTPPQFEPLVNALTPDEDESGKVMDELLERQAGLVKFKQENLTPFADDGSFHILHAAPAAVAPDHPQHGRWHVVVGRGRKVRP
jgi:hypothetical protein